MFTLSKENRINVEIPDNTEVTSTIKVWQKGKVQNIKVNLDIDHPFVGDLSVKLTSPKGTEVVLRNREGGSSDDIKATIEGEILTAFEGENAKGLWTLTVVDHATRDTGTLNSWGFDIVCDEMEDVYKSEIFIAQKDADQLTSVQECRFSGRVIAAEADVEIEHPLVGDLVVSLVSPSGTEVVIINREGGSQNHIQRHIEGDIMNPFKGDETAGAWTLKIDNFHTADNGVLKHWKVKFRYEKVDDLKKVEGIGPKIEGLLNNAGVWSWAGLATTSPETIKGILTAAGDRFKMHDPGSWPMQAGMAANGKWEELQKWQDEHIAGKANVKA